MRISLMSMPDFASCMDRAVKLPNLGLSSLAGNVQGHEVKVLDLVAAARHVKRAVLAHLADFQPQLIGLSAMTFQYATAVKIAALIRATDPTIKIALGGYHGTLMFEEIAKSQEGSLFDFIIRGEGELTFRHLVESLQGARDFREVSGLTYHKSEGLFNNPATPLSDLDDIRLPDRSARVYGNFHFFGKKYDVAETSRGCPLRCKFCCIGKMYSPSYRVYPIERVLADLTSLKTNGVQGVMFVDDNITADRARFKELCYAMTRAGVNDLEYLTQASILDLGADPELSEAMGKAGFKTVFVGIENSYEKNLKFLGKSSPARLVKEAIKNLQRNGIAVLGGFIVGNPDDDQESVKAVFQQGKSLGLDHVIILCLTPYPGTAIREELLTSGLITNPEEFSRYNGFSCNVRTKYLTDKQLSKLINYQSLKLYLNPKYFFNSRLWGNRPASISGYLSTVLENVPSIILGGLYSSRHRF